MDDLQKTQIKSAKKKQRNKFKIKENIIKHLNLLIDAEVLQILQKYVDQHKEQLKNYAQIDSQYIQKPFTLLQDCVILKKFKQMINQNCSYWSIIKCLSEKFKRQKNSIVSRLQNLFNCNKQKLIFCISNNLAIKIKLRYKTNSGSMIQNMKIITNQMILNQLKQLFDTKNEHNSSHLNNKIAQNLMILLYIKKYAGQLQFRQIFLIISQKMHLSKNRIRDKFYHQIIPNLRNSLSCSSQIQQCFPQNQANVQPLQYQQRAIMKVNSKSNSFKNNDKMLDISQQNISEVDTFINKLHESRFKEDNGSIIDILKEIQFSVKKQNELFMSSNVHQSQSLFFDDQQQIQDVKNSYNNFYQSLCIEQKSSKKNRKNQKKKRKAKMTVVEQHNLTFTESLTFQNSLQQIQQKWHLNPIEDEKIVYDESFE